MPVAGRTTLIRGRSASAPDSLGRIDEHIAEAAQSIDILAHILNRNRIGMDESSREAALAHQKFPGSLKLIGYGLRAVQEM